MFLDDLISLTGPSCIVLCTESVRVLDAFRSSSDELHKQLAGGMLTSYAFFDSLRKAADTAYNQIIDIAKRDLHGHETSKIVSPRRSEKPKAYSDEWQNRDRRI